MIIRRITATLLANVFLITTAVQTITAGAETRISAAENISISNDDINVESTNSFGSILAKEISAEQEEQLANNGCNVFSIEMDGTQANVEFQTVDDCTLVVGVYDETGETLLATGSTEVLRNQTKTAVNIEIDAMPEYFYLKGYLIESTELAPMCTVYENPNYTQKMQEFFSKTVDDFDAERVLNFDNDPTNNFAVYEENTILIPQNDDGYNVVASADDAACVYVIENVDDSFLSLEAGDIFAYQYGENDLLITKIAEIEVDGTTVTIMGGETSMDEVFEHVRIEAEQGMEDANITPAEGAVVVDENGDEIESPQFFENPNNATLVEGSLKKASASAFENSNSATLVEGSLKKAGASATETAKVSLKKEFETEVKGETNNHNQTVSSLQGSVKVSASFVLSASLSYKLYLFSEHNYVELQLSYSSAIIFSATGAAQLTVPIGTVGFAPVAGCIVEITPSFIVKLSGELSASGTWTGSVGLRADADSGKLENISKAPKFTLSAKAEGTFYFGLDLMPKISLINEKILSMSMTGNVGVEIVAKMSGSLDSNMNTDVTKMDKMHACNACIDGDLNFKYSLSFKVGLFKDKFSAELKLLDKTKKIGNFYYSFDYNELEFEECPHQLYRVELQCVNLKKKPIEGVSMEFTSEDTVMTADNVLWGTPLEGALLSDENGKAVVYIGKGTTTIKSTKERFVDSKSYLTLAVDKNGELKINNTKTNQYQIVMAPVKHIVAIHVENEEGEPLDLAKISIAGDGDTEYTNASGDAELKLPNGTYELTISDTGYQAVTQTLTIYDEGQSLSFQLVPNSYVYVRVTDEYGQPLQNAKVLISGVNDLTTLTNAEGIYKTELEEGDYTMTVSKLNYETQECAFTFTGDFLQVDVVLVCTLPKVTVIVEDEAGNRIEDAKVTYEGGEDTVLTGADGTAVLRIPLGNCSIKVSAEGFRSKSQTFTVDTDEMEVTLVLPSPMEIVSSSTISLGYSHSAAITEDGSLYLWGDNDYGQLGNGTEEDSSIPIKIMDNVAAVSLGTEHSAAITEDGSLYLWGNNDYGQLGNGTEEESSTPIKIMDNVVEVSLGGRHSAAITEDGSLYLWGDNYRGELGNGISGGDRYGYNKGIDSSTPIKIMDNVATVSLGPHHSAGITEDGSLYLWGYNYSGQLGNSTTEDSSTPIKIMDNVATVSLGMEHSAAITEDSSLYLWGYNGEGQLGNGSTNNSSTPIKIMDNVAAVSLGYWHSAAITEDGSPYLWGENNFGQLGNGNSGGYFMDYDEGIDGSTPIKIMDNVAAVSLGFFHSAAITEDGSLYLWGNNDDGQLGNGTTRKSSTPIKIMDGVAIGRNTAATSFKTESIFTVTKYAAPLAQSGLVATKSYTNLLPKTLYNFYVLRSDTAENLLSADNLLYLNQDVSTSDGTLDITYTPIEDVTDAVLLAVPAQRTISDASIVLDDMVYNGTTQTASPVVNYGGATLTEGTDYTLSGDTIADAVGAYMLTITGKGDYSGELTISYWMYCVHSYADGVCTICGTQCVHTYENGLCSVCGDTLPIMTTTSTTTSTTTTTTTKPITTTSTTTTSTTTTSKATTTSTTTTSSITTTSATTTTNAEHSVIVSGTCRDNLTWVLDNERTLTISGTGKMTGWTGAFNIPPWLDYRDSITNVIIEDGVTSIKCYAFNACNAITMVTIPKSVTSIEYNAFRGCDALTTITIPDSVKNIEFGAFAYCDALTSINVDEANLYFTSPDGILFNKNMTTLIQYPAGKINDTFRIPDSVTSINRSAFAGCTSLTEITIPDSVTSIGNDAFNDCTNLTSITIPDSVTRIGSNAFERCKSLTSITIKNPECVISDYSSTISDTATIYGYDNSTAQAYAEKNNRTFICLDESPVVTTPIVTTTPAATTTTTTTTSIPTTTSSITTTSATTTTPIVTTPPETTELDLGDVDNNKNINAVDASMILAEYAILATNGKPNFTEEQMKSADVNEDGEVNAIDASLVLAYYAHISTGGTSSLKEFILNKA